MGKKLIEVALPLETINRAALTACPRCVRLAWLHGTLAALPMRLELECTPAAPPLEAGWPQTGPMMAGAVVGRVARRNWPCPRQTVTTELRLRDAD